MAGHKAYIFKLLDEEACYPPVAQIVELLEQHIGLKLFYKAVTKTRKIPGYEDDIHELHILGFPGEGGEGFGITQHSCEQLYISNTASRHSYLFFALLYIIEQLSLALGGAAVGDVDDENVIVHTHEDMLRFYQTMYFSEEEITCAKYPWQQARLMPGFNQNALYISDLCDDEEKYFVQDKSVAGFFSQTPLQGLLRLHTGHYDTTTCLAFSYDNRYLISGSRDGSCLFWELDTGKEVNQLRIKNAYINVMALSADGQYIAAGEYEYIKVWHIPTGKEVKNIKAHRGHLSALAFSPDGRYLASATGYIMLWDMASGERIALLEGHAGTVHQIDFSPGGTCMASASWDNSIIIWEIPSGNMLRELSGHSDDVSGVCFSPDGSYLISCSKDESIRIWDSASGNTLKTIPLTKPALCMALSPNGAYLAVGCSKGLIELFEIPSGKLIKKINQAWNNLTCIAFSRDSRYLAAAATAAGFNYDIVLWESPQFNQAKMLEGYDFRINQIILSPDLKNLIVKADHDPLFFLDVSKRSIQQYKTRFAASSLWIPNTRQLFFLDDNCFLRLAEITTDNSLAQDTKIIYQAHYADKLIGFSENNGMLYFGTGDKKLKALQINAGTVSEIEIAEQNAAYFNTSAMSPDARYLALANKSICLWDMQALSAEKKELQVLVEYPADIYALAFSPDARYLMSGDTDGYIRLWETASGLLLKTLRACKELIYALAFSPDGRYFVSAGTESSIWLWESNTGEVLKVLSGHSAYVKSLAFTEDGRFIISAGGDRHIIFWAFDPLTARVSEALRLLIFPQSGDFVVLSPEGFFDGTEQGIRQHLHFVQNNRVLDAEPLTKKFYRPGLLAELLSPA